MHESSTTDEYSHLSYSLYIIFRSHTLIDIALKTSLFDDFVVFEFIFMLYFCPILI